MNSDGKVVIRTELDTSGAEKGLSSLEKKLQFWEKRKATLQENLEKNKDTERDTYISGHKKAIAEATEQINLYKQAIERAKSSQQDLKQMPETLQEIKKGFESITNEQKKTQNEIEKIGSSVSGVIKKVGKWALAVFSIRSVYSLIRRSVSTLSQYNEKMATDIEYIRFALATTLQPVIEYIIKLVYQLLGLINSIAKAWFGVDLFANASADAFNRNKKAINGTNKSAKELQKTLAGFDEMNILQDNGSTSVGGGGGGIVAPSFDLNQDNLFKNFDFNKFIEKGKEIARNIAKGINKFFKNTNWSEVANYLSQGLIGILDILIAFITEVDWETIGNSIAEFLLEVDWADIALKIFELLIDSMISSMYLMEGVTEKIIEKLSDPNFYQNLIDSGEKIINKICEGASKVDAGLEKVWSNIISFFLKKLGINDNDANKVGNKLGEGIKNGLDFTIEHLPFYGTFYKIIKFAKQAFGIHSPSTEMESIGENLIEGLKKGIKGAINGVIDIINSMINRINGALAFKWNKIEIAGIRLLDAGSINVGRIPNIPRMAKGGILNMPGRGVMVGSAIAGERGKEGVIPLTDSQQMALLGEAIGRYITVNLTNVTELDGRTIARKVQEVNNNTNFLLNR